VSSPAWRVARSLLTLRSEIEARWPNRDRRSDGFIGNAEHATRSSDHNPWVKLAGVGVVRAFDVDKDLTGKGTDALPPERAVEATWLAEHVRALGKAGDPRLVGGGYVIWNRRIASEVAGWSWRPYSGVNAHAHHLHVSVTRNSPAFDSASSWGVLQEDTLTADETARLSRIEAKLDEVLVQLYGPRSADGRIVGWQQTGGRTLVDAVAAVLDGLSTIPGAAAEAFLAHPVGPVVTMRKGETSTESIAVANALTRAAEASVVRQRDEAAAEVVTP
jgi:hypothetical protein